MTLQFAPCSALRRAALCAALSLILIVTIWPGQLFADELFPPRPISEAENAAVEAVVAFLDGGANAVLPRLAADSPMRAISSSHALDEIAVRMGAPEGSAWTLRTPGRAFEGRSDLAIFSVEFASGLDDIILMDLKQEGGSWVIHQIRCAVDPRMPRETAEDEMLEFFRQVASEAGASVGTVPSFGWPTQPPWAVWAAIAILSLALVLPGQRRRRTPAVCLLAAALLVSGCGLFSGEDKVEEVPYFELDALELGPLLPLRQALTAERGRDAEQRARLQEQVGGLVKELVGTLDPTNEVSVAARAWQSQLMVLDGSLGPAAQILKAIPQPDSIPLVAIVRARLAAAQSDHGTPDLYDDARKLAADHDGLALEAAWAAYAAGDEGSMERHMRSQVYMGSRDAVGHYFASKFDAVQGQSTASGKLFLAGWTREPLTRFEVLRQPLLTQSSRYRSVFEALDFMSASQSEVGPASEPTRPLASVAGATSHILGDHLVLTLGDLSDPASRSLRIPGGGDLSPEGTVVESPEGRSDREADAVAARFDELAAEMLAGAPLSPTDLRAVETLSQNLLRKKQWRRLIQLTEPLASKPEVVPPSLLQNRALALMRTGKSTAASKLLAGLTQDEQLRRSRPSMTYYQLGEMLAELGEYEAASRATERAAGLGDHEFFSRRLKQIQLLKALHQDKSTFQSRNLRMVYPAPAEETYPRMLTWVMEAEWSRIGQWVPSRGGGKAEVWVVPHGLYTDAYTKVGSRPATLYHGAPIVPFAKFETFQEDFIRTLSHQTAHAKIDQATRGRAPKWFHEGLARHVEMHQLDANPMPDLHERGRDLSIRLLEPIFDGWVDSELVGTAYAHATWTVRYIENQKGPAGIHAMLAAYRRGDDTSGALRRAIGTSVQQFDRDFLQWARGEAPDAWRSEVVTYLAKFGEEKKREELATLQTEKDKELETKGPGVSASLRREMRKWHADYSEAVRPVKAALARSLPLIQGQADGDVTGACRELRGEIDRFLGNRFNLDAPDPAVADALRSAYGSFLDMTQHCRSRKWKNMRDELDRAVQGLGQAQQTMQPYGLKP